MLHLLLSCNRDWPHEAAPALLDREPVAMRRARARDFEARRASGRAGESIALLIVR